MKNQIVKRMIYASAAAMLCMSTPAAVLAEEAAAQTEQAAENAAEGAAENSADAGEEKEEERIPEDVTVSLQTGDVVVKNETKRFFANAEYKRAESKVVEMETAEETADTQDEGTEVVAQTWNLILTEEPTVEEVDGEKKEKAGEVHTFDDVRADKWTDPVLTEEFGFLYIKYTDENLEEKEAAETAEEKELEKPVTIYVTTEVNVRQSADVEADLVTVTTFGEEWTAVASVPGWVKVEKDGKTGYVRHEYVTDDKAKLEELKNQKATPTSVPEQKDYQQSQSSSQDADYSYDQSSGSSSGSSSSGGSSSGSSSSGSSSSGGQSGSGSSSNGSDVDYVEEPVDPDEIFEPDTPETPEEPDTPSEPIEDPPASEDIGDAGEIYESGTEEAANEA